mmetsp:Transcript_6859/g.15858  ORF Transcript_6859/g.15858 Transcript_6859/m.15858 type:complete len:223 (-) Transcript_6859:81-749(-)
MSRSVRVPLRCPLLSHLRRRRRTHLSIRPTRRGHDVSHGDLSVISPSSPSCGILTRTLPRFDATLGACLTAPRCLSSRGCQPPTAPSDALLDAPRLTALSLEIAVPSSFRHVDLRAPHPVCGSARLINRFSGSLRNQSGSARIVRWMLWLCQRDPQRLWLESCDGRETSPVVHLLTRPRSRQVRPPLYPRGALVHHPRLRWLTSRRSLLPSLRLGRRRNNAS